MDRLRRVSSVVLSSLADLMRGFAQTVAVKVPSVKIPLTQVERNRRWRERNPEKYKEQQERAMRKRRG